MLTLITQNQHKHNIDIHKMKPVSHPLLSYETANMQPSVVDAYHEITVRAKWSTLANNELLLFFGDSL